MVMVGLVTAAGAAGTVWLVLALTAVVVVMAAGWPTLLDLPTRPGSSVVMGLAGAASLIVVALTGDVGRRLGVPPGEGGRSMQEMRWLAPVIAVSVVVAFTHQLLRRDSRPHLVESVTGVVTGVVVIALAAGMLACALVPRGVALAGTTAVCVVVGCLSVLMPLSSVVFRPVLAVLATTAAGLVVARAEHLTTAGGALTGLLIGSTIAVMDRMLTGLPSVGSRRAALAGGAAVVCAAGGATFLTAGLFA